MTKTRFNVGDTVKIVNNDERYSGCTGVIIENDYSRVPYRIKHVDGESRWYIERDVGPVIDLSPLKLKVGDKVRFASDSDSQSIRSRYFGTREEFTVDGINAHGNISVGGRGDRFFKAERFERIVDTRAVSTPAPKASSFKIGDFVEVVTNRHHGNQKGDRGYVTDIFYPGSLPFYVRFEGPGSVKKQMARANSYSASDLKILPKPVDDSKLSSKAGSFIVVNKKDGKFLPATTPYLHTTQKQAETEALRLADLPGVSGEFVVFKAVAAAVAPPAPPRPKAELKAL